MADLDTDKQVILVVLVVAALLDTAAMELVAALVVLELRNKEIMVVMALVDPVKLPEVAVAVKAQQVVTQVVLMLALVVMVLNG